MTDKETCPWCHGSGYEVIDLGWERDRPIYEEQFCTHCRGHKFVGLQTRIPEAKSSGEAMELAVSAAVGLWNRTKK